MYRSYPKEKRRERERERERERCNSIQLLCYLHTENLDSNPLPLVLSGKKKKIKKKCLENQRGLLKQSKI